MILAGYCIYSCIPGWRVYRCFLKYVWRCQGGRGSMATKGLWWLAQRKMLLRVSVLCWSYWMPCHEAFSFHRNSLSHETRWNKHNSGDRELYHKSCKRIYLSIVRQHKSLKTCWNGFPSSGGEVGFTAQVLCRSQEKDTERASERFRHILVTSLVSACCQRSSQLSVLQRGSTPVGTEATAFAAL